jgi:erythromycin esterase-like protein
LNKSSKQKLWVDNLQLKINNKSLNSYPPQNNKIATQEIKNKILINPETFKGLEKIEDFTTHRIIALGESVHGSDEIQQTSFQTIKYLIVHEQCKLLLLEIPFEIGLRINDYVLGKTSEDIETLMMFYNYNISNLSMLFNWIRKYNERTQNNIYISGIDMNFPWIRENHLLVYLKNQNIQNDSIKTVLNLIKDHEYKLAVNAIQLLSIEKNTQRCIIHALKYRMHKLDPAASLIEGNRDFIQFENARFAMETWLKKTDKAVIYAHLGHVNKKNSFSSRIYIPNFGNYMQKEYADDYFVIALLVGCGTISNTDSLGWNSELPLVSPPNGSIEDLCLRSGGNLFYKNLSKLNSLNSGRFIGYNYVFNQFYPYSHNGRFDAIIFIKNSHGYQYPQNWPRTKEEILEYFKKDKINEDS